MEGDSQQEASRSGLEILLHPLVVLNISDHWTRTLVTEGGAKRVVGALLGVQSGRQLELHTSFELIAETGADGSVTLDEKYLEQKKSHYQQVFPTYDLIGWYSTGTSLSDQDTAPHKTIMRYNESPLVLLMDPKPPQGTSSLPVWIYETIVQVVGDVPKYTFCRVPYVIESEESERISVDNVAHGTGTTSVLTPLAMYRDAVKMLQTRIKVVKAYLEDSKAGKHPTDHQILRDISSLCHKLPAMNSLSFERTYKEEFSDALLVTFLGTLTKACSSLNDLVEKHNFSQERRSRRGMYL